jgi:hypothetical protein
MTSNVAPGLPPIGMVVSNRGIGRITDCPLAGETENTPRETPSKTTREATSQRLSRTQRRLILGGLAD